MNTLPDLAAFEAAAELIAPFVPPTPQIRWPLLCARVGAEVWVKHENHTAVGAFKVRGGLVYMDALKKREPNVTGVIAATRGNHGQSIAFGARQFGLKTTIVVPHGNSREKNAAMRALGANLIEHGHDFQAALEHTYKLAAETGFHMVGPITPELMSGVGTYALEFFRAVPNLDTVYVPIGQGSGICALIAVRDALKLKTKIVGVVAEDAPAYALSFAAGKPISTNRADTIADGMACRTPVPDAVQIICAGADRIVQVSDAEIRAAMIHLFTDTHNVAEGAGAAALAGLLHEKDKMKGKTVGVVLSGGNVDRDLYASVIAGNP
jgi:threonine dehydratase